jgi:4-oxalocrotonate tautomerase
LARLRPRRGFAHKEKTLPFANIKLPQAALSRSQKEGVVHRITALLVDYFGEAVRPHTMVLIEEVPDGGYGRADEVFVIPEPYRAADRG